MRWLTATRYHMITCHKDEGSMKALSNPINAQWYSPNRYVICSVITAIWLHQSDTAWGCLILEHGVVLILIVLTDFVVCRPFRMVLALRLRSANTFIAPIPARQKTAMRSSSVMQMSSAISSAGQCTMLSISVAPLWYLSISDIISYSLMWQYVRVMLLQYWFYDSKKSSISYELIVMWSILK